MPRTLANWRSVITHALDGAPAVIVTDANATADLVINDAGHVIASMRAWEFLRRPAAALDFTASQAYVTLPTDFAEFEACKYNGTGSELVLCSREQLDMMRAQAVSDVGVYYGALAFPAQASQTVVPGVPRLELSPTPSANVTGALLLRYRGGWVDLTDQSHVANMPRWLEPLFEEVVRAIAKGREDNSVSENLERVMSGYLYTAAVERDSKAGATTIAPSFGLSVDFRPVVATTGGVSAPS